MLRLVLLVVVAIVMGARAQDDDGYTDENRPYKFGFNIQGHQHRKEEKDEAGIIRGEYGFITADGYYRVTVYKTDEKGDFIIVSMKNYYVGFPPDDPTTTPAPTTLKKALPKLQQPTQATQLVTTSTTTKRPIHSQTTQSPQIQQKTTQVRGAVACSSCFLPTTTTTSKTLLLQPSVATRKPSFPLIKHHKTEQEDKKRTQMPQNFNSQSEKFNPLRNQLPVSDPAKSPPQIPPLLQSRNNTFERPKDRQQIYIPIGPQGNGQKITSPNLDQTPYLTTPSTIKILPETQKVFGSKQQEQHQERTTLSNPYQTLQNHDSESPKQLFQSKQPERKDILDGKAENHLLYRFNYTVGFHGHHEDGYRNGDKVGDYFVNGRDGVSRKVEYVANEFGYQPNITLVDLDKEDVRVPKEKTEKEFGLKGYEFTWFRK